jgi:WD40 repeat protein
MPSFVSIAALVLGSWQGGGQKTALLDDDIRPFSIHLSRDGRKLAVCGGTQKGGDWKIFDLTDGRCAVNGMDGKLRCGGARSVRLSHNGALIAVGGNGSNFFLANAKTGALVWDLTKLGHVSVIDDLLFTPDDKYLISTGSDMMIRVWDIENKRPHAVFRFTSTNKNFNRWQSPLYTEPAKLVYDIGGKYYLFGKSCALSPDGKVLAVAGNQESKVPVLDLAMGKIVKEIKTSQETANALEYTPDGKWLLVGGPMENAKIEIWDTEKSELVASFGKHDWSVSCLAISPDKKTIVSGGVKDGFRVWDVATGKQKFSYFTREDKRLPKVKVFPDGSKYVGNECRAAGVAFLPDGKTFLIVPHWGPMMGEVYFHDTATGEPVDYRERVKALPREKAPPR